MGSSLLANNATVYIVDLDQKQTEGIAERYSQLAKDSGSKGRMIGVQGDVGSKAGAEKIFDEIKKREEYVTVLFNNAGAFLPVSNDAGDAELALQARWERQRDRPRRKLRKHTRRSS